MPDSTFVCELAAFVDRVPVFMPRARDAWDLQAADLRLMLERWMLERLSVPQPNGAERADEIQRHRSNM